MFFGQAFTATDTIYIPENRIKNLSGYRTEPLRGYGFVLAVFDGSECIGWTTKEDLAKDSLARAATIAL